MSRLVLPAWPVDPDMEVTLRVTRDAIQRVLAWHFHVPVSMTVETSGCLDTMGRLVFTLAADPAELARAAELYLDPSGLAWRVEAVAPDFAGAPR